MHCLALVVGHLGSFHSHRVESRMRPEGNQDILDILDILDIQEIPQGSLAESLGQVGNPSAGTRKLLERGSPLEKRLAVLRRHRPRPFVRL